MEEEDRAGINKSDYQPAAAAPVGDRNVSRIGLDTSPCVQCLVPEVPGPSEKGVGCMFHSRPARRRRLKPVICMQGKGFIDTGGFRQMFWWGGGVEDNIVKNKN